MEKTLRNVFSKEAKVKVKDSNFHAHCHLRILQQNTSSPEWGLDSQWRTTNTVFRDA